MSLPHRAQCCRLSPLLRQPKQERERRLEVQHGRCIAGISQCRALQTVDEARLVEESQVIDWRLLYQGFQIRKIAREPDIIRLVEMPLELTIQDAFGKDAAQGSAQD